MAFFGISQAARGAQRARGVSLEFLHRHGCAACPLNGQRELCHPSMPASGAARPLAYILGDAPDAADDRQGRHFAGQAGRVLRHHLPPKWLRQVRFNYVVRTRPPKDRAPVYVEIEACRPSVEKDIAEASPGAIIGLGAAPLAWAGVAEAGIGLWSGRRVPVMVGGEARWFFPIAHPSSICRDQKWQGLQRAGRYGSEAEFQFALHLRRALEAIEAGLPEPRVWTVADAEEGCAWVDGSGGDADVARIAAFLRRAASRKYAGIDYETRGLRPFAEGAKILSASVATSRDGALAFPLDHREAPWTRRQRAAVDEAWREFLRAPGCRKVAHHLSFEMEWSAHFYGRECLYAGKWGDSLSQAYVLDERPSGHNLGFLTKQYFGLDIKTVVPVDVKNLDAEPLQKVLRYNNPDAKFGLMLYAAQRRELEREGLQSLYIDHLRRVPASVLTQIKGIPINQAAVRRLGKKYIPRMIAADEALRAMPSVKKFERVSGEVFRPSNNNQVRHVVNRVLNANLESVDESALATVDHAFAREMIKWRKAAKVYGTYVMPTSIEATRARLEGERIAALRQLIGRAAEAEERPPDTSQVYPDGYAHPQTNVNRTRTSRTSSDAFNYQNWPKRGAADAVEVRGIIAPPSPDEVVVSFDYGQIQARNVGMESLDPGLLEAFWNDYDIHEDFMEQLFAIYPRWVKEGRSEFQAKDDAGKKLRKKYRNDVKHGFVFARFFGAGAKKTAGVLGVPISATERLDEIFSERFAGIPSWHARLERDYYKTGYVTGLSGYRRRAPVSYNERINSPIQADESKIVLDAMSRLSRIDHDLLQASMEIHDDLTFIWPKRRVDELADIVIKEMLWTPYEWARVTPIVVEMSVGADWSCLKEVGVFSSNKYDGVDMPRRMPK